MTMSKPDELETAIKTILDNREPLDGAYSQQTVDDLVSLIEAHRENTRRSGLKGLRKLMTDELSICDNTDCAHCRQFTPLIKKTEVYVQEMTKLKLS